MTEEEKKAIARISSYTGLIERNIQNLMRLKKTTKCTRNNDGSWVLETTDTDIYQGRRIDEVRKIDVPKDLADKIFTKSLKEELLHEAVYRLYGEERKKTNPYFNYAKEAQTAEFKREAIDWFNADKNQHAKDATDYVNLHHDELLRPVQERLLKEKIWEAVVVNYGTLKTIEKATDKSYQPTQDVGHCAKSVLTYMYQLQKICQHTDIFSFLPENPNIAAQPEVLLKYFQENWPDMVQGSAKKPVDDLAAAVEDSSPAYEKGTLVFIHNGGPNWHLMMYQGNESGKPEFIGFNPSAQKHILRNKKEGAIVDIPRMIRAEAAGKLPKATKQIEELKTIEEPAPVSIHMEITRTAVDGRPIKGFNGNIDIPNTFELTDEQMQQLLRAKQQGKSL